MYTELCRRAQPCWSVSSGHWTEYAPGQRPTQRWKVIREYILGRSHGIVWIVVSLFCLISDLQWLAIFEPGQSWRGNSVGLALQSHLSVLQHWHVLRCTLPRDVRGNCYRKIRMRPALTWILLSHLTLLFINCANLFNYLLIKNSKWSQIDWISLFCTYKLINFKP